MTEVKQVKKEQEWIGIIVARNGKDGAIQVHTMLSDYDSPQDAMGSAEAYVESPDFCFDNGLVEDPTNPGTACWLEDCYVGAVMDHAARINNEKWCWKVGMHIVANSRSGEVPGYAVGHPDPANPPDVGHPSIPTFIWPIRPLY
jgi:hypothetical protein